MPVKLHSDFLIDLLSVGDAALAGRVLRKMFDKAGRFIEQAKDDHRYDGITDAWIRYASRGMRVIFIKDGNDVLLYRAGQHSVEEHLAAPSGSERCEIVDNPVRRAMASPGENVREFAMASAATALSEATDVTKGAAGRRLLYNHTDRFLYSNLLGRRFLPHKDVYLISPFLSQELLRSTDLFGQMLDELIDGGATIWLVTLPPSRVSEIATYEGLAARNINVFFNDSIHAKVFAFVLNRDELKPDQRLSKNFVSIGSANLTRAGLNPLGLRNDDVQYELSYETTPDDWPEIEQFILHVTGLSTELDVVRANLMNLSE